MPEPAASSFGQTMGLVSILCAVLGWIAYCVGAFLCLSWIAPMLWVLGAAFGLAGAVGGGNRAGGCVGLLLNLGSLLLMVALVVFGVGLYGLLVALAVIAENS